MFEILINYIAFNRGASKYEKNIIINMANETIRQLEHIN